MKKLTEKAASEIRGAMNLESWKCHAKPAKLYGATCGFVNVDGGRVRGDMVFCRGPSCDCPKSASDARLARKEHKKLRAAVKPTRYEDLRFSTVFKP